MAYIKKIIAQEETLHGIARLHWIYVLKGIGWFLVLAGSGWFLNALMGRVAMSLASATESAVLPAALMSISNGAMLFLMAGGFFIFLLFVMKVLVTEIGMTDRRVMHKTGFIFVKVQQIDLEEIRGENMDLGYFGRMLGYGYIMLDCRFIGDVRLPAIENPERFIRGLHELRGNTQDSLSVVVGKGNPKPLNIVPASGEQMADPQPKTPQPEIQPGQPGTQPEVQPEQTPAIPEIQPEPTPHAPPPPTQPPAQPTAPPAQPTQPIPAPPPSEPPLQPPTSSITPQPMDQQAVAQMMQQAMPQMAQQIVKELAEQGMIAKPAPENDHKDEVVDNDLIAVFDDARRKEGDKNDHQNKLEHAIH